MVSAPHWGQGKWVAARPLIDAPQLENLRSVTETAIDPTYFFAFGRRRAPTRVTHIKMVPRKTAAPAKYHHV